MITTAQKKSGLVKSMISPNMAFAQVTPKQPQMAQAPTFTLPENYGFNELANYEGTQLKNFGQTAKNSIADLANTYSSDAAKRREALATSLTDSAQKTFELQNPKILEDLNSRGLATSPSAVNQAQTDALKEISLANAEKLNAFDTDVFNQIQALKGSGTSADLQAQQDALDAALNLRQGKLTQDQQNAQANQEQELAKNLADKANRNQLTSSLIGLGGTLGGSILASKLAGAGAGAATTGLAGAGTAAGLEGGAAAATGATGAAPAAGAGLGTLGGLAAIGGAGIGSALLSRAADKKVTEATGSSGAGKAAAILANPIGAQLNFAKDTLKKVFGGGSTGVNVGDQQRAMNDIFSQSNQLKQLAESGEITPEEYQAAQDELNKQAITLYHQTASKGGKAADNIRNNFSQFVNSGLITKSGADAYKSNYGSGFSSFNL